MLDVSQTTIQTINGADPENPKQSILNNLQANILKSHGRNQTYLLFLRFFEEYPKDPDRIKNIAKEWIRNFSQNYVTSADKQLKDAAIRKGDPSHDGGVLGCFFLSASGYERLGFSTGQFEDSFRRGMQSRQNYYFKRKGQWFTIDNKDPHPKNWQGFYQDQIHAMALIAGDDEVELNRTKETIEASLKGIAEVWVEHGKRLFYDKKQNKDIEPFGYRDGIKNPSFFFKGSRPDEASYNQQNKDIEPFGYRDGISNPSFFFEGNPSDEASNFDVTLAQKLVLVRDALVNDDLCYGSYFVFRKLEQDKKAFEELVKNSARYEGKNQALSGARIVGRFRDGTPVTKLTEPLGVQADSLDFNFDGDDGCGSPLHAHIRKANPRNGSERAIRIVRRGIPYNEIEDRTGQSLGMLFMCYQRNIHDQFELIQRLWLDNRNHPGPDTGVDRLVGQDWAEENEHKRPITLQGGEYFFAPSLNFLLTITNEIAK